MTDGRTSGEADRDTEQEHIVTYLLYILLLYVQRRNDFNVVEPTNPRFLLQHQRRNVLAVGTMFKTTQLPPPQRKPSMQPTQLPPPKITIDFGVLRRPDPRKTIGDVRGMHKVYKSPGYYDLEVFGYVDGKCPHCKCTPKPNPNKLGVVKMVHTSGQNAARVKKDGNRPRRRTWIHYRYTSEGN